MKKMFLVGVLAVVSGMLLCTSGVQAARPDTPSNLIAAPISNTEISLTWTDNSADESGFAIEQSLNGKDYNEIARVVANIKEYLNTNLSPGTTYHYRVRGFRNDSNGTTYSRYSNESSAKTAGQGIVSPAKPTRLAVTAVAYYQIDLVWQDNSDNESGFYIERSLDNSVFHQIADVPAGTTSYSDNTLNPRTRYYYRVRAYRFESPFFAFSDYSNVENTTTKNSPMAAPASLRAVASSYSQIDLTWTDNTVDETAFIIERSSDGGKNFTQIAQLAANSVSYSDTGLNAKTQYYYRARAYRSGDGVYSNYSSIVNATTLKSPVAAPSNLIPIAVSYSQIDLTWRDNSSEEDGFSIERSLDGSTFTAIAETAANIMAYSDTGLLPGTTYYYRIRGFARDGEVTYYSAYTGIKNTVTSASPVAAPLNPVATAASYSQIDLTWTDNSSNEDGFYVERSLNGTDFTAAGQVSANATSYSDNNLFSSTKYYYRVQAYKIDGTNVIRSSYSSVVNATTQVLDIPAPSNLAATTFSYAQIDLTWSDNSSNETSFSIERSLNGTNFFPIGVAAANATSYSDGNLVSNTTYYYRVRAQKAEPYQTINSSYSGVVSSKTGVAPAVAAPAGLSVASVSYYSANLSWTDNSDNETSFVIERSLNGSSFTAVGEANANITTYSDTGLNSGTTYYYRVRAKKFGVVESFYSSYSNQVNGVTLVAPSISAPSALAAPTNNYFQLDLTWADNSNNETGFLIERSEDGGNFTEVAHTLANTTSYSDTGLIPGTRYYYRVRAEMIAADATFYSSYSSTTNATTKAGPNLQAPTNLAAGTPVLDQISLTWQDNSASETEYNVERSEDGINFTVIGFLPANTSSYVDGTVVRGQNYYYRVRVWTVQDSITFYSGYSNLLATEAMDLPPAAPETFGLYSNGYNTPFSLTLAWKIWSNNEDGFTIEKSADGVNFVSIGNVNPPRVNNDPPSTSYKDVDPTLIPHNVYTYRVRAYNDWGVSAWSQISNWFTPKGY